MKKYPEPAEGETSRFSPPWWLNLSVLLQIFVVPLAIGALVLLAAGLYWLTEL